jgi:hypothetical protein
MNALFTTAALAVLLPALAAAQSLAAPAAPLTPATDGRHYTLGEFDRIEISGAAHVTFRQGDHDSVFVEGDEHAQRSLSLGVRRGQLTIRPSENWKFWSQSRPNVNVTARDLTRVNISGATDLHAAGPVSLERLLISISGAGLARFDNLKAGQLDFHVTGAGNGQIVGRVDQLMISVSGRSEFHGEDLLAQRAGVRISGIAEVEVWVMKDLQVTVSGAGTVDHWGPANVRRSGSGIARINSRGPKPVPP